MEGGQVMKQGDPHDRDSQKCRTHRILSVSWHHFKSSSGWNARIFIADGERGSTGSGRNRSLTGWVIKASCQAFHLVQEMTGGDRKGKNLLVLRQGVFQGMTIIDNDVVFSETGLGKNLPSTRQKTCISKRFPSRLISVECTNTSSFMVDPGNHISR